jgi:hypothetical protein
MFMRIQKIKDRHGEMRYYASVVRGERVKGKVMQTVIANIGVVDEEQIPYLKAAYAKDKPKLVWEDGSEYCPPEFEMSGQ